MMVPMIRLSLLGIVVLMSSGLETASSTSSKSTVLSFALSSPAESDGRSDNQPLDAEASSEKTSTPQLPASDPDADIPSLKLGESMKLDQLGPVIINLDGTTRRIDNWDDMTEKEREVTWRRISKRNKERRRLLMEKMRQQKQEERSLDCENEEL